MSRAQPVRSPTDGPEGALEGSRGLERSSYPRIARPMTNAEPRKGFQRIGERRSSWPSPGVRPCHVIPRIAIVILARSPSIRPIPAVWNHSRGSGRVWDRFPGVALSRNPPATFLNPFGEDVPGPGGLGRGDAGLTNACAGEGGVEQRTWRRTSVFVSASDVMMGHWIGRCLSGDGPFW